MRDKAASAQHTLVDALYDLAGWIIRAFRKILSLIWIYILAGTILATTIIGLLEFAGVDTGIVPSVLVDPIQVVALGALIGIIPARLVVNYFTTWHYEDVYRVDSLKDPIIRHYRVAPAAWDEREVTDGVVYSDESGNHYTRSFEQGENGLEVTGPHRGELNDVELETFEKAVKANRGTLRQWANIGQNLLAQLPSMAQSIESSYWQAMSNKTLEDSVNHPDAVRSQVVQDVEELTDSIETPGKPDAEEMMREAADNATDGAVSDVQGVGKTGDGGGNDE